MFKVSLEDLRIAITLPVIEGRTSSIDLETLRRELLAESYGKSRKVTLEKLCHLPISRLARTRQAPDVIWRQF